MGTKPKRKKEAQWLTDRQKRVLKKCMIQAYFNFDQYLKKVNFVGTFKKSKFVFPAFYN